MKELIETLNDTSMRRLFAYFIIVVILAVITSSTLTNIVANICTVFLNRERKTKEDKV